MALFAVEGVSSTIELDRREYRSGRSTGTGGGGTSSWTGELGVMMGANRTLEPDDREDEDTRRLDLEARTLDFRAEETLEDVREGLGGQLDGG